MDLVRPKFGSGVENQAEYSDDGMSVSIHRYMTIMTWKEKWSLDLHSIQVNPNDQVVYRISWLSS